MSYRYAHRAGLSLMECMIATAILSVSVVAVTEAIMSGQAQSHHTVRSAQAMALAEALMEEIIALPYADPQDTVALGPDTGETTRPLYDNCDDFHGYTELPGELRDAMGQLLPQQAQAFRRSVTAAYTSITVPQFGTAAVGLNVQVTVSDGKQSWSINRFIAEPIE